jgi:hypothetical protein
MEYPTIPYYGGLDENVTRILNSLYHYDLNGINNVPVPVTPNWFIFNFIHDKSCDLNSTHNGYCASNTNPPSGNFETLIQIALDSILSSEFNEENKFKAKIALYALLLKIPEYLDSNVSITNFYASYAGSTIQQIIRMNYEMEGYFDNQQTLIQTIKNNASDIYLNAGQIDIIDSLLGLTSNKQPKIDSLNSLRSGLLLNIQSNVNYDKTAFHKLDSTIAVKADLLNGQNDQINNNSTFEQNERTINDIYLHTAGLNKPTEVGQFAGAILNVASQCPLSGGPAVYRARSLYFLVDPFMSYDDANNCLQQGYLYRKGISARAKSYLYPNPASNEINIIYSISDDAVINILNTMSQVVYSMNINKDIYQTAIDVSQYSNGLYSYQIINKNGDLNDSGTFIINK